jgi:hypothetical protein
MARVFLSSLAAVIVLLTSRSSAREANLLDPPPHLTINTQVSQITDSFCPGRDFAYQFTNASMVEATVARTFSGSVFPNDFSVLVTARPQTSDRATILAMHNSDARLRISLEVGTNPRFIYFDKTNSPGTSNAPTFNGITIQPRAWTRFAYAVRGRQVTLYVNCQVVRTLTLDRNPTADLETNGLFVVGRQLGSLEAFEGDIQELRVIDDPNAAAEHCSTYSPDCDVDDQTSPEVFRPAFLPAGFSQDGTQIGPVQTPIDSEIFGIQQDPLQVMIVSCLWSYCLLLKVGLCSYEQGEKGDAGDAGNDTRGPVRLVTVYYSNRVK